MIDRGEKIVNLARELLRPEQISDLPRTGNKNSVSLRVLCIAAILAALGGSTVTQLINETRRPINRYEKVELDALVFYAARLKGIEEQSLRQDVETKTGAGDFADFTERDFRIARAYLQSKIR